MAFQRGHGRGSFRRRIPQVVDPDRGGLRLRPHRVNRGGGVVQPLAGFQGEAGHHLEIAAELPHGIPGDIGAVRHRLRADRRVRHRMPGRLGLPGKRLVRPGCPGGGVADVVDPARCRCGRAGEVRHHVIDADDRLGQLVVGLSR